MFRARSKQPVPPPSDPLKKCMARDSSHVKEEIHIAGEGSAEMSEICHVGRLTQGKQTEHDQHNDEILHFHRDEEIEVNVTVRKHHAERHEDAVHRTRCSYHHRGTIQDGRQNQLRDSGNDPAHEIEEKKLLWAPQVLNLHPEHPKPKEHVEKEMHDSCVHELIRDQLPGKESITERQKRKVLIDGGGKRVTVQCKRAEKIHQNEHDGIRDHQPFDDKRKEREPAKHRGPVEIALIVVIRHYN